MLATFRSSRVSSMSFELNPEEATLGVILKCDNGEGLQWQPAAGADTGGCQHDKCNSAYSNALFPVFSQAVLHVTACHACEVSRGRCLMHALVQTENSALHESSVCMKG